eukprot:TRINITY_DN38790_c0_g1_i2.p1 TRINITY_DN38790_c0_g1~~TRINITY_DN38790_c0_g1_i2.p1  ORF type:complete len:137 (+),score=20.54 TRINITY_DN38790_c0_g1_i2:159-569(+)
MLSVLRPGAWRLLARGCAGSRGSSEACLWNSRRSCSHGAPDELMRWFTDNGGFCCEGLEVFAAGTAGWGLRLAGSSPASGQEAGSVLTRSPASLVFAAEEASSPSAEPLLPGDRIPRASKVLRATSTSVQEGIVLR